MSLGIGGRPVVAMFGSDSGCLGDRVTKIMFSLRTFWPLSSSGDSAFSTFSVGASVVASSSVPSTFGDSDSSSPLDFSAGAASFSSSPVSLSVSF